MVLPESDQNTTAINLKFSAITWKDTSDLPGGSFSIADCQDYFKSIIKKNNETLTKNLPIQILLGSTKKDADKGKGGENVPKLESVKNVLVHYNLVKNDYQNTSKVLFTSVLNKQFGRLINILSNSLTMMNTVKIKFSSVEIWFTDQVNKALEIEDNVNLTLIIG